MPSGITAVLPCDANAARAVQASGMNPDTALYYTNPLVRLVSGTALLCHFLRRSRYQPLVVNGTRRSIRVLESRSVFMRQ